MSRKDIKSLMLLQYLTGSDRPTTSPRIPRLRSRRIWESAGRQSVDAVAGGWADSGDRLETRKEAARAVLEYALEDGAVGKSEEGRELHDKHPVMGQNFDTWWRKNIRPVLKEYGQYSQGAHGYVVEEI